MKSLINKLKVDHKVIVTGCLPVVMEKWLKENAPEVEIIFPDSLNNINKVFMDKNCKLDVKEKINPNWDQLYTINDRQNTLRSIIEISRGCVGSCAYCVVKHAKGPLRSRTIESVVDEIEKSVSHGSKEIWLTSQDTGTFGWDKNPKYSLIDLLESINKQNYKDVFIRLGMMTPHSLITFKDRINGFLQDDTLYNFLHIPIQAGSNKILKLMNRKSTREQILSLIKELRENNPELIISTDIIVGFPQETNEDYLETLSLIQKIQPEIINISRYTDRPKTKSSKMKGKIPTEIKSRRSKKLQIISNKITENSLEKWIGWTGNCLITEKGKYKGQVIGRNSSYLPIVFNEEISIGTIIECKITSSESIYLIGKAL